MSRSHVHAAVGAAVAVLPDAMLLAYGWRRTYLPPTHPLVRAHRALHHPASALAAGAVGAWLGVACWASHGLLDRWTDHPLPRRVQLPTTTTQETP